jgi:hypothetical protein
MQEQNRSKIKNKNKEVIAKPYEKGFDKPNGLTSVFS